MQALRILLAEDDRMIGDLISEMLTDAGHHICAIAATQAAAVSAANHHRPDLMLVDVNLGKGCGIAAMAAILRDWFLPHCYMTGDVQRATTLRAQAVVLVKPFAEPALFLALQHAMQTRRRAVA